MSHLTLEILARIADGPATAEEAAHLAACAECRAEMEALRAQAAALGELPTPTAPEAVWRRLEERLAAGSPPAAAPIARRRRVPHAWLLRAAAAGAIFAGGALFGASLDRGADRLGGGEPARATAVMAAPDAAFREADSYDPTRRLAALESIIMTAGAALVETPEDPVIGGYYRTAIAERQALLSQVGLGEGEGVWF